MNSRIAEKLAPWVFTIAIFVIWEASCRVFRINTSVLQPPSAAFERSAVGTDERWIYSPSEV